LDFSENLEKNAVTAFRERFKEKLNEFIDAEGYRLTEKPRTHYALDSFMLNYNGTSGNRDNIKVEINYLNRTHILPLEQRNVCERIAGEPLNVLSVNPIEIYASKTVALLSRAAPRDLYDVHMMVEKSIIADRDLFRKCFAFYNVCGGDQSADNIDYEKFGKFTFDMIRRQLKPVLEKTDRFDVNAAVPTVREYLLTALSLSENEKEFVRLFREKIYKPELLFDDKEIVSRIQAHPMVLWRLR